MGTLRLGKGGKNRRLRVISETPGNVNLEPTSPHVSRVVEQKRSGFFSYMEGKKNHQTTTSDGPLFLLTVSSLLRGH